MAGREGLRLRLRRAGRSVARGATAASWAVAAVVAAAMVDLPLHARLPAHGGPVVPFDPASGTFPAAGPRSKQPTAPSKKEEKPIEYSPWEEVPT